MKNQKSHKYIKIWLSYRDYFKPLTHEQIGQLITILMDYAESGVDPDLSTYDRELQILWTVLEREYHADQEYVARCRDNGRKGGRATAERRAAADEHSEN